MYLCNLPEEIKKELLDILIFIYNGAVAPMNENLWGGSFIVHKNTEIIKNIQEISTKTIEMQCRT